MKVLIDGKEKKADKAGFIYGPDISGRECRTAFHLAIREHSKKGENFKVITSGHVYVINFNPETFVESSPMTMAEFRETKKAS